MRPFVKAFFDEATFTVSYVVVDPPGKTCAVIDSVLDFDPASGRTHKDAADAVIAYIEHENLKVEWILETHVHADHLSAAPYLKQKLGGKLGIGFNITVVQNTFGKVFNAGTDFARDGSQFDHLFTDNETFSIGNIKARAIHTPGHTPGSVSFWFEQYKTLIAGDTLFLGSIGRTNLPGGNFDQIVTSIKERIYSLDDEAVVVTGHGPNTTIGSEKAANGFVRA